MADTSGFETVGVRRRGGLTAGGEPLPVVAMDPVDGCVVEPLDGAELVDVHRTGATAVIRVLMPVTTGLDHLCELQVRGLWYRIVGDVVAYDDDDPELSGYHVTATRGIG